MSLRICSLASGSSGNATYIASERTSILVDCGTSAREIEARLGSIGVHPEQLDGILISHSHVDHYRAAGTIHARHEVPVFVDPSTARSLEHRGRRTSWKRIREARPLPERIGEIEIEALDTSHGVGGGEGRTVAFTFRHRRSCVGVVTDLGLVTPSIGRALRGIDAVVLEANYDEAVVRRKLADPAFAFDWRRLRWLLSDRGHLSNRQCAEALASFLVHRGTHVFLGHLSANHADPRWDNNSFAAAARTVREVLSMSRIPLPALHETSRIGLRPSRPSVMIDV